LEEKVAAPVWKSKNTAVGIHRADHAALSIRKSWQPFANHWQLLGWYTLLAG
jgi:hypothetical protein